MRDSKPEDLQYIAELRAKIESLKKELIEQQLKNNMLCETVKEIKAEAYKEVEERLKERYQKIPMWGTVAVAFMEEIVQEMVGGAENEID